MLKKSMQAALALCCITPFAAAAPNSIGTANARGNMRVDNYAVDGNATLFSGSVVKTGQASANLRLGKDVAITMASDSQGTLYRNRIVLQHGSSEVTASTPFELDADGLQITPDAPDSHGFVSLKNANTVNVSAVAGSFKVTSHKGVLLASVHPGMALNFTVQDRGGSAADQSAGSAQGANSTTQPVKPVSFTDVGIVDYANGHYYLTDGSGNRYEITGKEFKKYVGDKVVVVGTEVPLAQHKRRRLAGVVLVSKIGINGASGLAAGMAVGTKVLVSTAIVGAGVGTAVGVYEANQPPVPASR